MKPSLSYVLFLLFIRTAHPIFFTTAVEDDVKDATGKKVVNGVPYHIGPASGKGGAIKLLTDTVTNKTICQSVVLQDPKAETGGEFMFTLIVDYDIQKYMKTAYTLGIDSGACDQKSTFWTINDVEGTAPDNLITTGGSYEEEHTCFQVVEYPKPTNPKVHSYMLQHCPSFCGGVPRPCYNVSVYLHKGVRRLGIVGGTPFEFVFHKITK